MTDKKRLIIEKASELFAKNGFEATSVQEITDACGISKGSFYLSFKSKESLLFSIFEYFSTKLVDRISGIQEMTISPEERLKLFFVIQFEEIARYSDFILMQMREQITPMNEEMMVHMNNLRSKTYDLQQKLLVDVYGDSIRLHMPDLSVILSGIAKGYIEIIVLQKTQLDFHTLADYILQRIRSIILGLTEPYLTKEQLVGFAKSDCFNRFSSNELLNEINAVLPTIESADARISLEVIKEELAMESIRKPVLSGMMSNLKKSERTEKLFKMLQAFIAQS